MGILKSIFTRKQITDHVRETHELLLGLGARTVEESFLIGSTMNRERAVKVFKDKETVIAYLHNGDTRWSELKLFNQIEVSNLIHRANFIKKVKDTEPTLTKFLSVDVEKLPRHVLRDLSVLGSGYPNITWSLKLLALVNNDCTLIQPNTTPCQKASYFLFGNDFNGDQLGHTLLCRSISDETGLTPLEVNTALWSIGGNI